MLFEMFYMGIWAFYIFLSLTGVLVVSNLFMDGDYWGAIFWGIIMFIFIPFGLIMVIKLREVFLWFL